MKTPFPDADHELFVEAVNADLPAMAFVARDRKYTPTLVEQDIVPEARVYSVRFTPGNGTVTVAYVAVVNDRWSCLTGKIERFNAIASLAHRDLGDAARARRYATIADSWTTSWKHGQLEIASLDEVPWNEWQDDLDKQVVADVRARFETLGAERIVLEDGTWTIDTWVLASQNLMRRHLAIVQATGALARRDEILAEALPVPLGRHWQVVDGRLIPTG